MDFPGGRPGTKPTLSGLIASPATSGGILRGKRSASCIRTDLSVSPESTNLWTSQTSGLSRGGAVEVGFEPTEPVKAHALSRRARSAASVLHLGQYRGGC